MKLCRGAVAAYLGACLALAVPARAETETAFEHGLALFKTGDFANAIGPLVEAHRIDPADPDTALMLGIAYYRTGHLDAAYPLLVQAERAGDVESQASARVFLGLIADARGEPDRAHHYYTLVAHSPTELGTSGRLLLELSGPERWSVAGIVRPGYDSNVALLPATAMKGTTSGDGEVTLIGTATGRPTLDLPVVLDETLVYRRHAQQTDFDILSDVLGATATLAGATDRGSLAYHFEVSTLGGARYQTAHVADLATRHDLGHGYGLGGRYTFAARDYVLADYAGYTGITHTAVAELSWGSAGTPHQLFGGYVFEREGTADPSLSSISNGATGTLRVRPWRGAELRVSALGAYRSYDAASNGRRDVQVSADATLHVNLTRVLGVVIGGSAVHNTSNDASFEYIKWTTFLGLVAATGS